MSYRIFCDLHPISMTVSLLPPPAVLCGSLTCSSHCTFLSFFSNIPPSWNASSVFFHYQLNSLLSFISYLKLYLFCKGTLLQQTEALQYSKVDRSTSFVFTLHSVLTSTSVFEPRSYFNNDTVTLGTVSTLSSNPRTEEFLTYNNQRLVLKLLCRDLTHLHYPI